MFSKKTISTPANVEVSQFVISLPPAVTDLDEGGNDLFNHLSADHPISMEKGCVYGCVGLHSD